MNLCIIGGGPAGLSAAIRAREDGLEDVLVIERADSLGGILNQCIHHGFGVHVFKEELTGPEYSQRLIDRALKLGVKFALGAMVIDIEEDRTVTYVSPRGLTSLKPGAVVLAMGCRERSRGAIGIPGGRGSGVYSAGTAQEMVNMKGFKLGQKVVILGSGDIGLIMARRMALEGADVLGVYEIAPHSGGLKRNIAQCLNDYGIPLFLSHTVTRTKGLKTLEGVYVAKVDENYQPIPDTEHFIPCDTLLLSVGLIPENELATKINVEMSPITGGAIVNNRLETSIPGVFAAGNALHVHDLVDHVTLESYDAAANAVKFIRGQLPPATHSTIVTPGHGVRYTVPMALIPGEPMYTISFRSSGIYSPCEIKISADGETIRSIKKRAIIPSEMERVRFVLKNPAKEVKVEIL
ncbi:MAG: NAD(P)/FAD-dependent oxidoreductase [Defluviitaleaceae bacterium]|nr:NAD(P)/FAD-dependent oxidoreductase [Defluviitaleaceae bacterium]